MKSILTCLVLLIGFSGNAQNKVYKIVKEYSRGDGPTLFNDGKGYLNLETHYNKEGQVVKEIRFGAHGYKSQETLTSYNGAKPVEITRISYPNGFWPGQVSLQSLSIDHPMRKPDTSIQKYVYRDTLHIKTESFYNGKMSGWTEYTYNEDGFEIELISFRKTKLNIGRWTKTTRDNHNRPIKFQELNQDSSIKYTETKRYNSMGLLSTKEYQSQYRSYHAITRYTYNSDGLKTKEVTEVISPEDMKSSRTQLFQYNSRGLLAKEGHLDSLGKTVWYKTHTYNSSKQKIRTDFDEFTYFYSYNQLGDLISSKFEDSRSAPQSKKRFIYKNGLLQKTEHYNREALTYYTKNYYSKTGKLIRQEPMPVEGQEALDWIKYFYYNDQGQLDRIKHKHPNHSNHLYGITTVYIEGQAPQPKPDPYKNYVNSYTYYTYDNQGRQLNEYYQGGHLTRITKIYDGDYGIMQHNNDPFGMPSTTFQMISRLDTVKKEKYGSTTSITLNLDYAKPVYYGHNPPETHYHQNLTRVETFNQKGELVGLKETTSDGIVLFNFDGKSSKSLGNRNTYSNKRLDHIRFGRYTIDTVSTTLYNSDSTKQSVTNIGGDTIEYTYNDGQLSKEIKRYGSGYFSLTSYDYDKKGFKTLERIYKEDGTENDRVVYENDGKNIISEQRIYVRPNRETLYEISYPNP